ncbi:MULTISPECIES: McrB family protein [unclassified Lentimonas]|uniref:McrB family protein n=1 Tax=unclassified Lentimonas TaxID=2630993 RepID=UPI001389E5C9|nr:MULTISPECIES: hypothetical protein [unclassified Lentimonas]
MTAKEKELLGEEEIKDKDRFAEKITALQDLRIKISDELEKPNHLSSDSSKRLRSFLTEKKPNRIDLYGKYKGLSRTDAFQPAAAVALGLRIDHHGIINDIIKTLQQNRKVTESIIEFYSGKKRICSFKLSEAEDVISSNTKLLFSRFALSTLTKPFTILTGASGTGKTKLATALATYLSNSDGSNSATIAVGADWTDNRSVLGFVNHLRPLEGKPSYQSTPILDLILRSKEHPESPHFLILDEMNLSHVERYFSDFLSTMEQTDGSLELHKEGEDKLLRFEGDELRVPHRIEYPHNLFVIGTVNIDETTYMFSPKVLDRANVIEFTVSEPEIEKFLREPKQYQEVEPAEPGVAEGFLQIARQAQKGEIEALKGDYSDKIADHLLNLFKILKDGRFEFAYRTAKEVNTYLRVCRHLADDSDAWDAGTWKQDLDNQILQKLLPKLHGSMGRIGGLLAALAAYCHKGAIEAETAQAQTKIQLDAALQFNHTDAAFPKSLQKLQAMIQTLRDEQFVSFIQ